MRPSSYNYYAKIPTYAEEKDKLLKGWKSEVDEVIAKIKGSSLNESDKRQALKEICINIMKEELF